MASCAHHYRGMNALAVFQASDYCCQFDSITDALTDFSKLSKRAEQLKLSNTRNHYSSFGSGGKRLRSYFESWEKSP